MVLVCHPHKFIYLKTHKTGSTTVELFLEPLCAPDDHVVVQKLGRQVISEKGIVGSRAEYRADLRQDQTIDYWFGHMAAKRVRRQLGPAKFDQYTKIACIRNPFRRMISKYLFRSVWNDEVEPPSSLSQAKDEFRAFMIGDGVDRWPGAKAKTDHFVVHIEGRCVLDAVLRTESLEEDLRAFFDRVGITWGEIVLPRARDNGAARREWAVTDFFDDPALVDRAIELDEWVFDLGGYSKDPADA